MKRITETENGIITVNGLFDIVKEQIEKGNGNKAILISCDDEGNGYHSLFFGVIDEYKELKQLEDYFHDGNNAKDVIILGQVKDMDRPCGYMPRKDWKFPCNRCENKDARKCKEFGGREPITCLHCKYCGAAGVKEKRVCYKRRGYNIRPCEDFEWD